MNELDKAYRHAKDTAAWIEPRIQGLSIPTTVRNCLAASSYGLAVEHQRALVALIEAKAYGSTLALLRPTVECFARGYWLLYLADDDQIKMFSERKATRNLDFLLRKITEDNARGPHKQQMQTLAERLNTLTHGDVEHLAMRIGNGKVGPQYDVEHLAQALRLGAWVALMAAMDMVGGIGQNVELATTMLSEVDTTFTPEEAL